MYQTLIYSDARAEYEFTAATDSIRLRLKRKDLSGQGTLSFFVERSVLRVVRDTLYQDTVVLATGNGYRYGFNGMERDDEFNGVGNSYDFGARIYDARIGRWLARDPLDAKYPNLSPYNFVANNPLFFVDRDGRDYVVHVDHKEKTIIIKATYYTTKGDEPIAQEGVDYWESQNGKFKFRTVDGKKYKVVFDLEIKSFESEKERDDEFYADRSGKANRLVTTPISLVENWGETRRSRSGGANDIEVQNGGTASDRKTPAHEMGHTLGLFHFKRGLMMDGSDRDMSGKTNESNFEITLGNVSRILNNVGIGELQMTESDKETSEGLLPDSHVNARRVEKGGSTFFDRGKVVIND